MQNIAIVVHSCDKYEFVWERWAASFQRYMPKPTDNNQLSFYFLSEDKQNPYKESHVTSILTSKGKWSDRLLLSLWAIREPLVFYMQEDMFPKMPLGGWHLQISEAVLEGFDLDAFQISPNSKYYDLDPLDLQIKRFRKNSRYLMSHQPRLWRKDFLLRCLIPGESPWVNETAGTKRIRELNPRIGFFEWDWYDHMVKRGKWIKKKP